MAKPAQVKKTIKDYFDEKHYSYNIEEKKIFNLFSGFKTTIVDGTAAFVFSVSNSDINAIATYLQKIPQEQFPTIAELMLKVNRYLKRGHFFLDYETGSVNFKMWESTKGRITAADIEVMISITVGSVEGIMKVIASVVEDKVTIDEAVKAYVSGGGFTE